MSWEDALAKFVAPWRCLAFFFGLISLTGCSSREPETLGGPPEIRRLSEEQYRNSIADIFGADTKVPGRFEPDQRVGGLLAIGTSLASITPAAFEQYDVTARAIAAQVLDEAHRAKTVSCTPGAADAADDPCTAKFTKTYLRKLFRRTPTDAETARFTTLAHLVSKATGDSYAGLQAALAGMLVSSEFLFRTDATESDPASPGKLRLTSFAKAQRLSFLLWNTSPDEELLAAAERGDLHDAKLLGAQADRMLASPRLEQGVRALFNDMYGFDDFKRLAKDPQIFSRFNFKTAADAQEETLRTISDHLLKNDGDYRELFTTQKTNVTRTLGLVYLVPVATREGFEPFDFSQSGESGSERAGILTHASFLALHSHPGRSSATLRGKAVRELILCQTVPRPPPNVDFSVVQDTSNVTLKTARDRVSAHLKDAACASCHKITDPIGLALEQFDGSGVYRTAENGVPIDASGDLDGRPFKDAVGLGKAVYEHPDTAACLVKRVYETGAGREPTESEAPWLTYMTKAFASDDYKLRSLLRRTVTSAAFYRVSPVESQPGAKAASAEAGHHPEEKNS